MEYKHLENTKDGVKGKKKSSKIRKGFYLTPDVIDSLKSQDKDLKTLKKFHYDQKEVDFVEVLSDIVKNNIKEKKRLNKLKKKGIDVREGHIEYNGLWGTDYQTWREDYDGSLQDMKRRSKEIGCFIVDFGIEKGLGIKYLDGMGSIPLEQLSDVFGDFFGNGNKWKELTVWDKDIIELLIYEGMRDRLFQIKWESRCVIEN